MITASATSARGCSDASSTNSSGLCALPPRGPSPSTVIGTVAAKWLASRRAAAGGGDDRRPSAALARSSSGAVARLGVHARPAADQLRLEARRRRARRGCASSTSSIASSSSARRSQNSSPWPGTTLNASPERMHGRDGGQVRRAVGVVARGDRLGGRGEREQRVAAAVGRRARVRGAPVAGDVDRARGLAAHDDALVAVRPARRPRSTGTASKPAKRATWPNARGAPLLVAHEQQRDLGVALGALGEARAARRARARRRPSCRPRRSRRSCSPSRCSGLCSAWATTVSTWPSSRALRAPVPVQAGDAGPRRGPGSSTGPARAPPRRARARRTATRTPPRRGRRRRARRRPRAPRARAARGARSPPPPARSTGPSGAG